MAGSGRRVFSPGEVLTASNTMNYLMDQTVMNFAGTAARGSAIGTAVSEGMVSYLADTNVVQVYNGTDWFNLGPTGQILQIVSNIYAFQVNNNTTTYSTTGLSATITPTKASSKILVLANVNGIYRENFNVGGAAQVELRRGATALANITNLGFTGTALLFIGTSANFSHVDSPNTTSPVVYEAFIRSIIAGNGAGCQQAGSRSDITLIEVSA
jgi:hypothetical protein